ncbi:MAG: hypothetical protein U0821_23490 [Chloroflexota bacterium]
MSHTPLRLGLRLATLAALAAFVIGGHANLMPTSFAPGAVSVVYATVAQGKDSSDDERRKNRGNDEDEDHNIEGQVLAINNDIDPPELTMANVDGNLIIRVLKTDEIKKNGIKPGDAIKASGEKIHELLFEATELEITKKCCKSESSGSNNKKKKKNDNEDE